MSHHSSDDDERLRKQFAGMFGEFPDGRLGPTDEGAIPISIGTEKGRVVLRFPRRVHWVGMTPEQAMEVAESLVKFARECGCNKPLTLTLR